MCPDHVLKRSAQAQPPRERDNISTLQRDEAEEVTVGFYQGLSVGISLSHRMLTEGCCLRDAQTACIHEGPLPLSEHCLLFPGGKYLSSPSLRCSRTEQKSMIEESEPGVYQVHVA